MNGPEEKPQADVTTPVTPQPTLPKVVRPAWMERMLAADSLEDFLGIPRGGHRDPSPGEARPRWPHESMHPIPSAEPQVKPLYEFVVDSENHTITDASPEGSQSIE